jgi:hypothetical protein
MGSIVLLASGVRGAFAFAWYLGLLALGTGYFYALLINGTLGALRLVGRVGSPDETERGT